MVKKILIIKLGALGDVVRTSHIAKALKDKYPESELSWLTKQNAIELFIGNPYVDKIFTLDDYPEESFDMVYNFDIDDEATKIASIIKAKDKYGFYSQDGYPAAFNPEAEYYLNLLFDDDLKKSNKKTYEQMIFEIARLEYKKQPTKIYLNKNDEKYSSNFIKKNNIDNSKLIGIHMGASSRWPSKVWHKENLKEFIKKLNKQNYEIILFAGPNEIEKHKKLISELKSEEIKVYQNNPNNSLREFASLANLCKAMVCSDSLSMHISLALNKPTIALFFCTSFSEVEDYGILKKIISPRIYDFFPEKMDQYNEELVKSISASKIFNEVEKTLSEKKAVNAIVMHPENKRFLILKRKEGIHNGKWAFPGGLIENNESEKEALKRELFEETGLELKKIIKKISEYSYKRDDGATTKGKCFLVKTKNYEVKINNESLEFKWVNPEELNSLDFIEGIDEELMLAYSIK